MFKTKENSKPQAFAVPKVHCTQEWKDKARKSHLSIVSKHV